MTWDEYYKAVVEAAAKKSSCLSIHHGAVIVKGKSIVSTGFNGPPSGCRHCDDPYHRALLEVPLLLDVRNNSVCPRKVMGYSSGKGLKYCQASHAELNAIVQAARNGIAVDGTRIYCDSIIPCRECAKAIINAGIVEVVVEKLEEYSTDGILSSNLFSQAGVKLRRYGSEE